MSARHPVRGTDLALMVGVAARVTRFLVHDELGEVMLVQHVRGARGIAAQRFEGTHLPADARVFRFFDLLEDGLDCAHCAGTWVSAAVVGSWLLARRSPALLSLWRLGAGVLTLSYANGHLVQRLDGGSDS